MLTTQQLAAAAAYNERAVVPTLRLRLPAELRQLNPATAAFAVAVAASQQRLGLAVDGKLGPVSSKALIIPAPEGIDISAWNVRRNFNVGELAKAGLEGCYVKVGGGEGRGYVSKSAAWQVDMGFDLGWAMGAYWFVDVSDTVVAQIDRFWELCQTHWRGRPMLPPVLDIEWFDEHNHLPDAAFERWMVAGYQRLSALFGGPAGIYLGRNFWLEHIGRHPVQEVRDARLFVADHSGPLDLPPGFNSYTWHQYTGRGSVRGYRGDIDRWRFNGTSAELRALAQSAGGFLNLG